MSFAILRFKVDTILRLMSQNLLQRTSAVVKFESAFNFVVYVPKFAGKSSKIEFEVKNFIASSNENYLVRIDGILNASIFTDHKLFIFLGKP